MRARLLYRSLFCVAALAVASGCSVPGLPKPGLAHVWVGSDANSAFMVQLTRDGNHLSGTFDLTGLASSRSTDITPIHTSFSGTIDGSAITLTFDAGLGFSTSISGTLDGNRMTLNVPLTNGQLVAVTLKPGTVEEYNRLANGLGASAAANAATSAAAVAATASARATEAAREAIDRAAQTLASDVAALRAAERAPDFSAFDDAIRQASTDLQNVHTYAAQAAYEGDPFDACNDAFDASSAAFDVQSDAADVDSAMLDVQSAISSLSDAADQVKRDLSAYQRVAAALAGYTPANAPDTGTIQALLNKVAGLASTWQATGEQYQSQVADLVTEATDAADAAQEAYC